ncbi:DUF3189 family protein [Halonatronum saccharophilum]|uniref:DUF3189 family protein n=1 Tax=Halonatronum saccharophilum TaxID=150060 RepID=UPI00048191F3|nr:DUF3189 family protein [Halonatronum saccharophilum]
MEIIYHDSGGSHSVAIAANLHLNNLPMDRVATKEEVLSLPTFDKIKTKDIGHLLYQGDDEFGNSVYTLGCKRAEKVAKPLIKDTYSLLGDEKNIKLVDTRPAITPTMMLGGFLSRGLGLAPIGRPIVTNGALKTYPNIVEIVRNVKRNLQVN